MDNLSSLSILYRTTSLEVSQSKAQIRKEKQTIQWITQPTCSLTPQREAPHTVQNKKQEQKHNTGLDKTHHKTYDSSYVSVGVLKDLKLQEEEMFSAKQKCSHLEIL